MSKVKSIHKSVKEEATKVSGDQNTCCGPSDQVIVIHEGQEIREKVQEYYADHARSTSACCGDDSQNLLYESDLLSELPEDVANFTLGCGDPITLANLKPGEVVLDLGSGGGLDCFLAAKQVGEDGYVIGLDMTPEMIERARSATQRMGLDHVEFRQGYLEEMPIEDERIDVIVSNCVINLSPDKPRVFAEMYRTLKPGGRISVSDIVSNGELPDAIKQDMVAWGACIAGALQMDEYIHGLEQVGFDQVKLEAKDGEGELLEGIPEIGLFSASITAVKPHP